MNQRIEERIYKALNDLLDENLGNGDGESLLNRLHHA